MMLISGLGANVSGIMPNESIQFMSHAEQQELFGAGSIKPDTMKIPVNPSNGNYSVMTSDNMDEFQQMQGEFKIERGFAGMDRSL